MTPHTVVLYVELSPDEANHLGLLDNLHDDGLLSEETTRIANKYFDAELVGVSCIIVKLPRLYILEPRAYEEIQEIVSKPKSCLEQDWNKMVGPEATN